MPSRLENSRRGRVLPIPVLRFLARVIVQPDRLGQVAEAWEGIFRVRPYGLPLKYRLGPRDNIGNIVLWCGWRVLDIGANTGLYSTLACAVNPRARTITWEPVPDRHEKCVANLALNRFENRSEVCTGESTTASLNRDEALFKDLDYRLCRLSKTGAEQIEHLNPAQTVDHNFLAVANTLNT